jgi:hypothetical protein
VRIPPQQHLEERDHGKADHQHVQGREAVMHQHLVDDHLEEERRDQREELQHEGGDQHLHQDALVFENGRDEPGDVELGEPFRKACPLGHQQQAPGPDLFELGLSQRNRPVFFRVMRQGLGFLILTRSYFGENKEAAILGLGDGR